MYECFHDSERLAFVRNWTPHCMKLVCSFANKMSGTIFIGMESGGRVLGIGNARKLVACLPFAIRAAMSVTAVAQLYEKDGKEFVILTVTKSIEKVKYQGVPYLRLGSVSVRINEFMQLYWKRPVWAVPNEISLVFDHQKARGVRFGDLDKEAIAIYRRHLAAFRPNSDLLEMDDRSLLMSLSLMTGFDDGVSMACALLFHPRPSLVADCWPGIDCAVVRDGWRIVWRKELKGPLVKSIDFILRKFRKAAPAPVLRELVANAVSMNWYEARQQIQIRVDEGEFLRVINFVDVKHKFGLLPACNELIACALAEAGLKAMPIHGFEPLDEIAAEEGVDNLRFLPTSDCFTFKVKTRWELGC